MKKAPPSFEEALDILRNDPSALPWQTRHELVTQSVVSLQSKKATPSALPLFKLLGSDPKWEVRKEVADHLHLLSENEFASVATQLLGDENAFVQTAAERALERRKRGNASTTKRKRGLDHVQTDLQRLEKAHGEEAAHMAESIAHQLYEVLVGATVHDMRGILTSLKGNTETLMRARESGSMETAFQIIPRMRDHIIFMERLLDDMRVYTQTLPRERHRERLADLVNDGLQLAREEVTNMGGRDPTPVEVIVNAPETITIEVSRIQMVLAFKNLIKNAHEAFALDAHRFGPGRVEISANSLDAEQIEILIADNGMGLSPDELEDVRRFLPGKTSKKYLGTGFGLPIAKRNIEAHGGTIAIESVEDEGTRITVKIPIEARGRRKE